MCFAPEDLTPLDESEASDLVRAEYWEIIFSEEPMGVTKCRVYHPHVGMTICIRKRNHAGDHATVNPYTSWPREKKESRRP